MQVVDFQELPISDLLERQPVPGLVGIRRYRYSKQGKATMHRHNFYTMELILEGKSRQKSVFITAFKLKLPFGFHRKTKGQFLLFFIQRRMLPLRVQRPGRPGSFRLWD